MKKVNQEQLNKLMKEVNEEIGYLLLTDKAETMTDKFEDVFSEVNTALFKLKNLREENLSEVEFTEPELETAQFGATGIPEDALPFPKPEEMYNVLLGQALDQFKSANEYGANIRPDGWLMNFLINNKAAKGTIAINPPGEFSDNIVTMKRNIEFETLVLASYIERLETDLYLTGGKEDLDEITQMLHDLNIKICTKIYNHEYIKPKENAPNVENLKLALKVLSERSPEERERRTYKSITRPDPQPTDEYLSEEWDRALETIEEFNLRTNN